MKRMIPPLFAIIATITISGIEVFQTSPDSIPGKKTMETIFVIFLAILFAIGIFFAARRRKEIKAGLVVEDELSRLILRISAATTFFLSLIIWLVLLVLNTHTDLEPTYLFGFGLMGVCLVFLIVWTSNIYSKININN